MSDIDVSTLIGIINEAMTEARKLAEQIARGVGGREIALAITKLEEARHRAVDAMMLLQSGEIENGEAK
jgi:hypothetical protein